jgi:hypothetical protein
LADGWPQALGALFLAGAAAGVIAASSWSRSQSAGRLAIFGIVLFLIALIWGSELLVGLASLPVLVAALVSTVGGDNPAWIRALVVGVLWFLAAELGWDAIERRDGVRRTAAYSNRRIDEATTIVLLSLAVTLAVFLASRTAPLRTVFVMAIALLAIAAAIGGAAQRLRSGNGEAASQETKI